MDIEMSSPRPWGCFQTADDFIYTPQVFPTPVGVFPFLSATRGEVLGLPHARGGVSEL